MSVFDDVNNWEKTDGANLFSSILNVNDPVILDYGCGSGNYSFAAAQAFGQKCKVYAVDINKQCLDYVSEKSKDEKIDCIIPVEGKEDYCHERKAAFSRSCHFICRISAIRIKRSVSTHIKS